MYELLVTTTSEEPFRKPLSLGWLFLIKALNRPQAVASGALEHTHN